MLGGTIILWPPVHNVLFRRFSSVLVWVWVGLGGRMMVLLVLGGESDLDETRSSFISLWWGRRFRGLLHRCLGGLRSDCSLHRRWGRSGAGVEVSCWFPSGNGNAVCLVWLFSFNQKACRKGGFFEKEVGEITVIVDGDKCIVFDICRCRSRSGFNYLCNCQGTGHVHRLRT